MPKDPDQKTIYTPTSRDGLTPQEVERLLQARQKRKQKNWKLDPDR